MASNLEPKEIADHSMESFSEASNPGLKLSEPKEIFVIGSGAEVASATTEAISIMKLDKSTMTDKDLMSEQTSNPRKGAGELHQALAARGSERGIDFALVVELASDSDNEEEHGPYFLIDVTEEIGKKIKVMVIVSMIATSTESANFLFYTGDFILEVNPKTTIRKIKFGITKRLDVCYEDMALVYLGKFMSDARSVEYYFIDNGKILHLIVESPDQLFKMVFAAFTNGGFKRFTLAVNQKTRPQSLIIIHVMQTKYHVGGLDKTPAKTKEQLLYEIEHLDIPDTDDSEDSSADEDGFDLSSEDDVSSVIHVMQTKYHVGGSDETPAKTKEQLLYEIEHLVIPDTDDSEDSSADEDGSDLSSEDDVSSDDDLSSDDVVSSDDNVPSGDDDENSENDCDEDETSEDDDENSENDCDEDGTSDDDDENSEDDCEENETSEDDDEDWDSDEGEENSEDEGDEDETSEDDDEDWDLYEGEEWEIDEDDANELAELIDYIAIHVHIVAHFSHVGLFEWI